MEWQVSSGKYIKTITVDVIENGSKLELYFPYDVDALAEVRVMAGAKYVPADKAINGRPHWTITNNERNQFSLECLQGKYSTTIWGSYPIHWEPRRKLFTHQHAAVVLALRKKRCLWALEMGLGKTLAAIELMEELLQEQSSFEWWLVAPFGALKAWERELKKWDAKNPPVISTTYESLHKYLKAVNENELPKGVIFDESIKIKTPSAQRSQVASELSRLIRIRNGYIVCLSGAPAPKDPTDWWHQIEVLQPGFIREGSIFSFRDRYAIIEKQTNEYGTYPKVIGWNEEEIKNLGQRLAPLVLAVKKSDVMDLPEKIFDEIQLKTPDDILRYAKTLPDLVSTPIELLEKLRELSDGFQYEVGNNQIGKSRGDAVWIGSPKEQAIIELLDFYSQENGGPGRLVIYAYFHATIDKLKEITEAQEWYPMTIDGRGWSDKDALTVFSTDTNKGGSTKDTVIIANPACVHGLTLTETPALVYYSNGFSVDARIQSQERRDRPGMDLTKGTRIVDLLNLPTDRLILEKLKSKINIQKITLEEIRNSLNGVTT